MHSITLRKTCLYCCSFLLLGSVFFLPKIALSDEILIVKTPAVESPSMPKVMFNHDKHVNFVESHDGDCSRCHAMTSAGLSTTVLNVKLQKKSNQIPYLHMECTRCHAQAGAGPSLAECRTCHVVGARLEAKK
ncbi:MAG: cytochrome c family protein [Desulfovibrio sp.]|nr:cytochrome c family protein [Desulfovibrio sp.]